MKSKNQIFTGTWESSVHTLKVKLSLIQFQEDGAEIVYCPALEVTGYGNTVEEA